MDPPKRYRVQPPAESGRTAASPSEFTASGDFDALAHAHRLFGTDAPFDLFEDQRLVVRYRPQEAPKPRM